jgi:hypothetical protein
MGHDTRAVLGFGSLVALLLPWPAEAQTFKGGRILGSAPDGAFVFVSTTQWDEPRSERTRVEVHAPDGEPAVAYSLCVGDCDLDEVAHDKPLPADARCVLGKDSAARARTCAWDARGSYAPLQALPLTEPHGGPRAVAALLSDITRTLKLLPLLPGKRGVEIKQAQERPDERGFYAKESWGLAYLLDLPRWHSVETAALYEAQGESAFLFLDHGGKVGADTAAIHTVAWIPKPRLEAMRLYAGATATLRELEAAAKPGPPAGPTEEKPRLAPAGPDDVWVRFSLRDEQGFPLQRVRYVAKSATGQVVDGRTPLSGTVEIRGLPRGAVEVSFPDFDSGGWQGARPSPALGEATVHEAGSASYLPAITWRHGFADWRRFKVHADATALEVGDVIHFPARRPPRYLLKTGSDKVITVKRPRSRLSINIDPLVKSEHWSKSSSYAVDFFDGQKKHTLTGKLGPRLHFEEMVPVSAIDIEVHATVTDEEEGDSFPMDWPITFRGAPAYESEEGDWARLDCAAERRQVGPDMLRRYERLVAAAEAMERSLALEPHFRPGRILHVLLLGRARIPWPEARRRLARLPAAKPERCFGPEKLGGRQLALDDLDGALAEYSLDPQFKAWLESESDCR